MKKLLFLLLVTSIGNSLFAQEEIVETPIEKTKKTDHYIGVQANYLVREFFNFGGSNSVNLNPFGFVYHLNSIKSGIGFRVGLGPSIYSTKNIDGLATINSKGYNLNGRLGFDKRFHLNTRWEAGVGLDAVVVLKKDESRNDQINNQGIISETRAFSTSYCGGPMGYLRYKLRPNILLGTETSFYILSTDNQNRTPYLINLEKC